MLSSVLLFLLISQTLLFTIDPAAKLIDLVPRAYSQQVTCTYTLELFEGDQLSDFILNLNQEVKAVASTSDPAVDEVEFRWIDPANNVVQTTTKPIAEAQDLFTPSSSGSWTVEADFRNGTVLRQTVEVGFFVLPESPIGPIAIISAAIGTLWFMVMKRRMNSTAVAGFVLIALGSIAAGITVVPANADAQSSIQAPSGLTANAVSASQIDLSWTDNSINEGSFHIERATGNGPFVEIATVGSDAQTYSDTGLDSGVTYTYRVRAGDEVCNIFSDYSNTAGATTPTPDTPPEFSDCAFVLFLHAGLNTVTALGVTVQINLSAPAFICISPTHLGNLPPIVIGQRPFVAVGQPFLISVIPVENVIFPITVTMPYDSMLAQQLLGGEKAAQIVKFTGAEWITGSDVSADASSDKVTASFNQFSPFVAAGPAAIGGGGAGGGGGGVGSNGAGGTGAASSGAGTGTGGDFLPSQILGVMHDPFIPLEGQSVTISANVTEPVNPDRLQHPKFGKAAHIPNLTTVKVRYVTLGDPVEEYKEVRMKKTSAGSWQVAIPEEDVKLPGVVYWIVAEIYPERTSRIKYFAPMIVETEKFLLEERPLVPPDAELSLNVDDYVKDVGSEFLFTIHAVNKGTIPLFGSIELRINGQTVSVQDPMIINANTTSKITMPWMPDYIDVAKVHRAQAFVTFYDMEFSSNIVRVGLSETSFTREESDSGITEIDLSAVKVIDMESGEEFVTARTKTLFVMLRTDSDANMNLKLVDTEGRCIVGTYEGCVVSNAATGVFTADKVKMRITYSGEGEREYVLITDIHGMLDGKWTAQIDNAEAGKFKVFYTVLKT